MAQSTLRGIARRCPTIELSFPFLRLRREIRDLTYEPLLATPHTFAFIDSEDFENPYRPFFDQCTAILLVNKQISDEALAIFRSKNEFIVLRFVGCTNQCLTSRFDKQHIFPSFPQHQKLDSVTPVPDITIQSLSKDIEDIGNCTSYTLWTTVQALDIILRQLWAYMEEGGRIFKGSLNLTLKFQTKNPHRRSFLHEHILKPWDQALEFKAVFLEGDIDNDLQEHLKDSMTLGLHPDKVTRYLELYKRRAEDYQKQMLYRNAGWYWEHLYCYWMYNNIDPACRDVWIHNHNGNLPKYDLEDTLYASQSMILPLILERVKISLKLQNYSSAGEYAGRGLEWLVTPTFPFPPMEEREVSPIRAKLYLSHTIDFIQREQHEAAFEYLEDAVADFVESNTLYHINLTDLKDKLCWAIDQQFMSAGLPHRY